MWMRLSARLLRPAWATLDASSPHLPEPLRAALHQLDTVLHQLIVDATAHQPAALELDSLLHARPHGGRYYRPAGNVARRLWAA